MRVVDESSLEPLQVREMVVAHLRQATPAWDPYTAKS
jgi:hypothetical protein